MFTGLVESIAQVKSVEESSTGNSCVLSLAIENEILRDVNRGDSIAVNGCCLTVTDFGDDWSTFDVSRETLAVTNLRNLKVGSYVNLERAMPMGKRIGGHLVSGHIDGLAELSTFEKSRDGSHLIVTIKRDLSRYTIKKGSATLDGISLTINDVVDNSETSNLHFMIIPETLARTTLGHLPRSWAFNIEVDMLAKFAERLQQRG